HSIRPPVADDVHGLRGAVLEDAAQPGQEPAVPGSELASVEANQRGAPIFQLLSHPGRGRDPLREAPAPAELQQQDAAVWATDVELGRHRPATPGAVRPSSPVFRLTTSFPPIRVVREPPGRSAPTPPPPTGIRAAPRSLRASRTVSGPSARGETTPPAPTASRENSTGLKEPRCAARAGGSSGSRSLASLQ